MSSAKLESIARRLRLPDAPLSDDLTAAIERLVNDRVDAALEERKRPPHVQRLMDDFNRPKPVTDYRDLPPVQTTPAPKVMEATIERDGAGLARAMVVNGQRFIAQRDGAGQLVRIVSEDLVSEVTYNGLPVPPPNRKA